MRGNYRKKLCLLLAALLCAALLSPAALAAESSGSNRFNVEIVLDASGSMQKTDPSGYRYEAIRLFANLLAERGNVLGGLVFSTGIDARQSPAEVTDQTGKNAVIDQLESVPPTGGWTNIFIYPGYRFKVMDALITNFHLPESTLIMLVSALAGREHILAAYEEAVREKYRFFSFGDAMFIS